MTKTYLEKPAEVQRKWYVIDAEGKTLGRLAARVASVLRGKHKVTFTPHVDTGDHVVIMSNGGFGNIHEKLLATLRNA